MKDTRGIRVTRHALYGLIIAYVCCFAMGGLAIQYANYVSHKNDLKWCDLMNDLNKAYISAPPVTDSGKKIASSIANLKYELGC